MQGAPETKPRHKTAAGLGHLEGIISSKAQEKPAEKRQSFIRGPSTTKPHPRNNQAASKLPQGSSKSHPVSIFPFLLPTILALYAPHRYPCPGVGVFRTGWRSSFCTGGAINYAEAVTRVLLGWAHLTPHAWRSCGKTGRPGLTQAGTPKLTPQADHKETGQVLDPHLEHCVAHYSREAFEPLIGPCWL